MWGSWSENDCTGSVCNTKAEFALIISSCFFKKRIMMELFLHLSKLIMGFSANFWLHFLTFFGGGIQNSLDEH